jgi:hypothetical protein
MKSKERGVNEPEGSKVGYPLTPDLFLYLLDLEVKKARRYQNFLSVLILELTARSTGEGKNDLSASSQRLAASLSGEIRETDVFGLLGDGRLGVILPYADGAAAIHVKSRFESMLRYFDFDDRGWDVQIHQACYPDDGTDTEDLLRCVRGSKSALDS